MIILQQKCSVCFVDIFCHHCLFADFCLCVFDFFCEAIIACDYSWHLEGKLEDREMQLRDLHSTVNFRHTQLPLITRCKCWADMTAVASDGLNCQLTMSAVIIGSRC